VRYGLIVNGIPAEVEMEWKNFFERGLSLSSGRLLDLKKLERAKQYLYILINLRGSTREGLDISYHL